MGKQHGQELPGAADPVSRAVCMWRTHIASRGDLRNSQLELLRRKGNTGEGFGIQGKSPQKVKPTGSPLQQSRVQNVSTLLPRPEENMYINAHQ